MGQRVVHGLAAGGGMARSSAGGRDVGGEFGARTRESAYLVGPGEASEKSAAWSG